MEDLFGFKNAIRRIYAIDIRLNLHQEGIWQRDLIWLFLAAQKFVSRPVTGSMIIEEHVPTEM